MVVELGVIELELPSLGELRGDKVDEQRPFRSSEWISIQKPGRPFSETQTTGVFFSRSARRLVASHRRTTAKRWRCLHSMKSCGCSESERVSFELPPESALRSVRKKAATRRSNCFQEVSAMMWIDQAELYVLPLHAFASLEFHLHQSTRTRGVIFRTRAVRGQKLEKFDVPAPIRTHVVIELFFNFQFTTNMLRKWFKITIQFLEAALDGTIDSVLCLSDILT